VCLSETCSACSVSLSPLALAIDDAAMDGVIEAIGLGSKEAGVCSLGVGVRPANPAPECDPTPAGLTKGARTRQNISISLSLNP